MERKTALMVSIVVSGSLVLGATAFAVSLGLSDRSVDNVGNLQPVATDLAPSTQPAPPAEVTVYVDPVTGMVSNTPSTTTGQASAEPVLTPGVEAVSPPATDQAVVEEYDDRGHDDRGSDGGRDDDHGSDGGDSHETGDDDD